VGGSIQVVALMTMGALGTQEATKAIKIGIISCVTIWASAFGLGWASVVHVLTAELPSSRLRDLTYRTASIVNITTQSVP
jgi:SP family sugar:H+ symporter-like MFS transporter